MPKLMFYRRRGLVAIVNKTTVWCTLRLGRSGFFMRLFGYGFAIEDSDSHPPTYSWKNKRLAHLWIGRLSIRRFSPHDALEGSEVWGLPATAMEATALMKRLEVA